MRADGRWLLLWLAGTGAAVSQEAPKVSEASAQACTIRTPRVSHPLTWERGSCTGVINGVQMCYLRCDFYVDSSLHTDLHNRSIIDTHQKGTS